MEFLLNIRHINLNLIKVNEKMLQIPFKMTEKQHSLSFAPTSSHRQLHACCVVLQLVQCSQIVCRNNRNIEIDRDCKPFENPDRSLQQLQQLHLTSLKMLGPIGFVVCHTVKIEAPFLCSYSIGHLLRIIHFN
jgi:hypothetical protein